MTLAMLQADFRDRLLRDDPHAGLAIYRSTYRAQLMDCLADTFAATRQWLGDQAFDAHAAHFVDAHPPSSWSLDHYPAGFGDWLAASGADQVAQDLCRIEWALAESFVAPGGPVLTPATLAQVDWDQAQLCLPGTARLLHLRSNAAAIWVAFQHEAPVPEADLATATVLVWRRDHTCHLRDVAAIEGQMLGRGRFAFADLCDLACADRGEQEGVTMAGALLAQWAAEQALMVA